MSDKKKLVNMDRAAFEKYKTNLHTQAQAVVRLLAINSAPGGRETLARTLGFGVDHPDRSIAAECGYPAAVDINQFRRLYERHGVAQRVVDCWADESWLVKPAIYETEKDRTTAFEKSLKELFKTVPLLTIMHRADRLSGLGRYGGIILGFDDTSPGYLPENPVKADGNRKLLYAQTYPEDLLEIGEVDKSPWSPRCGHPLWYWVSVGETRAGSGGQVLAAGYRHKVHWTRVVHLAETTEANPVYSREKMRAVYDFLLDLRKVLGGSAEMFWKGAFPGFALEMLPEYVGNPIDDETIRAEMDAYHNHLQRWIATEGFKVNPIAVQISSPAEHVAQIINVICATLGIPVRIFMGTESGHLASTQDAGSWDRRVKARRDDYLEPMVIRPVVNRLIEYGVVAKPRSGNYIVSWPDSMMLSDMDRADVALKSAQTLMQYVTSGAEKVMPLPIFLTKVMKFTDDEKDAVIESLKDNPLVTKELWDKTIGPSDGGRKGAARGGRPADTSSKA